LHLSSEISRFAIDQDRVQSDSPSSIDSNVVKFIEAQRKVRGR
jgi:hypothetical protein